jgi:hypothetical protein
MNNIVKSQDEIRETRCRLFLGFENGAETWVWDNDNPNIHATKREAFADLLKRAGERKAQGYRVAVSIDDWRNSDPSNPNHEDLISPHLKAVAAEIEAVDLLDPSQIDFTAPHFAYLKEILDAPLEEAAE